MQMNRARPLLVALSIGAAVLAAACSTSGGGGTPVGLPEARTLSTQADPGSDPIVQVVQAARPAVVNVTTTGVQNTPLGVQEGQGTGTGFIIRSDGILVTNYHVVEGAQKITVITPEPHLKRYDGRVIGGDPSADLAVIQIEGKNLPTIPLGRSEELLLGEPVVAIGYALALEGGPSVTTGIVSALDRVVAGVPDPNCAECEGGTRTYQGVIQTDAAINAGNSGGPLLNLRGEVVGINSAGVGASFAENVGFAISIDTARETIEYAVENPGDPGPYLGVVTQAVSVDSPGLPPDLLVDHGVYVADTAAGGAAEDAEIETGDVIVGFDGNRVGTPEELSSRIQEHDPGDRVDVDIIRPDGTPETVEVTLGVNPLP